MQMPLFNGKSRIFSRNEAGYQLKKNFDIYFTPYRKINFKDKNIKLLEENISLWHGNRQILLSSQKTTNFKK